MECINSLYKPGKKIKLKLSQENKNVDLLEYSEFRLNACENLFASYLNNTTEEANKFNLDRFLDEYTLIKFQNECNKDNLVDSLLKEYCFLKNYYFDWTITFIDRVIVITIKGRK